MEFSTAIALNIGTIIFAAGILYGKLESLSKKVEKLDEHREKIARLEAIILQMQNDKR